MKYLFSLVFYTDGDFCFRSNRGSPDDIFNYNRFIIYDYKGYRIAIDEFDDSYQYAFSFEVHEYEVNDLIMFLKNLETDLVYSDTHIWIKEQLHELVENAISFLQQNRTGTHIGTLADGNWQPSLLCITTMQTYITEQSGNI